MSDSLGPRGGEKFELYRRVRVIRLVQPPDSYDSWSLNQRAPQVGDVGTYIDRLRAPGLPDVYVVEMCDANGVPVWLSDFLAEELEMWDEESHES